MATEELEKLLIRSDSVGGRPVAPAPRPQTFAHVQPKHRQMTSGSSVNNWLRMRAVLNVCTGRRARRLLRRASWLLLVGGVAYLVFLTLLDHRRSVDKTGVIPVDQQRGIIPPGQQPKIPERSTHDASGEERSSYSLASTSNDVPIEPLKNSSPVSPDRNRAVPANDGGYVVQVSAERSDAKAQASFKTLQSRYPHVLGGRSPLIRRVKLGEKGVFYRAQIGPFDTVEKAKQLCVRLKSAGGHCMVQKNS